MSTAPIAHVDALWWLMTVGGYSKSIFKPGDMEGIMTHSGYAVVLWDASDGTVLRFEAPTRAEMLDRVVAYLVAERLS